MNTRIELPYLLESSADANSVMLRFFGFNTLVTIEAFDDDAMETSQLDKALMDCLDACNRYEQLFSRTIADSDIGRLNDARGKRIIIDCDTFDMLQAALFFCEASDGVFDITAGAVTTLWDFHEGVIPTDCQLEETVKHIDWRKLHLFKEDGKCYAQLLDPESKVDVGGIAKGWIGDKLIELLKDAGVRAAIVDLGGNVVVLGRKPDGRPWRIGIRDPQTSLAEEDYLEIIELSEGSIGTSGTYERCFDVDDETYHHILDVRTGKPLVTPWAAVSIVSDNAMNTEGYSTSLLSMNESEAQMMMEEHPEIRKAIFVRDDGEMTVVGETKGRRETKGRG